MAERASGQCAGCHQALPKREHLRCTNCKTPYDLECANVSVKRFNLMTKDNRENWKCPECINKRPKVGNINTPIRPEAHAWHSGHEPTEMCNVTHRVKPAKGSTPNTSEAKPAPNSDDEGMYVSECRLREILQHELKSTIRTYVSEELKHINVQLSEFKESLTFFNQQYEDLKNKFDEKCTVMNRLETENIALASSVKDLSVRLTLVEQQMRENNVEINGVPEHRTENLFVTVKQLAEVVKSPVNDGEILHVARVAKLDKNSSRPRSVIVKLRSPRQRDALLAAVLKFNRNKQNLDKLSSQHLGIAGPQTPIFVAEHLTPANKSLHAATRKKAKEMGYKFVWVRNGRIFVRKSEESGGVLFIGDKDSLNKII